MNAFTKEELELFLYYEEQADGQSPLYYKIQSMIDNYCEHEWSDGSGVFITCFKCHAIGGKR